MRDDDGRYSPSPEQQAGFLRASFENRRMVYEELYEAKDRISKECERYPVEIYYKSVPCRFVVEEPEDIFHLLDWIDSTIGDKPNQGTFKTSIYR